MCVLGTPVEVKDNFWESILSGHYVVPEDQTEVFRLDK